MGEVPTTRTELLALRARQRLARQGRDLLEEKRRALLHALRAAAGSVVETRAELAHAAREARLALEQAMAREGVEAVGSAAWVAEGELRVEAGADRVMGVAIPLIRARPAGRALAERGYGLTTSGPDLDLAAERYETEVDLLLEVASRESRLRRLAHELRRTGRRASALRHLVLPRLARQQAAIALALEEREREELFRLQRLKSRFARDMGKGG